MGTLILDTDFLIEYERECRRRRPGRATHFLEGNPLARFVLTSVIAGELAAGADPRERDLWEELLASFRIVPTTRDVSWTYGQLYRQLKAKGHLIGSNDMWIAAAALTFGLGLVTGNIREFRRVDALELVPYR